MIVLTENELLKYVESDSEFQINLKQIALDEILEQGKYN